jgi:hypothetical protein
MKMFLIAATVALAFMSAAQAQNVNVEGLTQCQDATSRFGIPTNCSVSKLAPTTRVDSNTVEAINKAQLPEQRVTLPAKVWVPTGECRDTASQYGIVTEVTCRSYASGRSVKMIFNGNGRVEAFDDGNTLRVSEGLEESEAKRRVYAGPGQPDEATYYYAPAGELPACNSANVVKVLARITGSTLAGIMYPRALGANNGRNLCTVGIARWSFPYGNPQATYTVEWTDQASGRYWVQITGRLAR